MTDVSLPSDGYDAAFFKRAERDDRWLYRIGSIALAVIVLLLWAIS